MNFTRDTNNQQRIGNAEREAARNVINAAVNTGHLNAAEADERVGHTYDAQWPSDLDALVRDLPGQHHQTRPLLSMGRARTRHGSIPIVPVILLILFCAVFVGHIGHLLMLATLGAIAVMVYWAYKRHRGSTL